MTITFQFQIYLSKLYWSKGQLLFHWTQNKTYVMSTWKNALLQTVLSASQIIFSSCKTKQCSSTMPMLNFSKKRKQYWRYVPVNTYMQCIVLSKIWQHWPNTAEVIFGYDWLNPTWGLKNWALQQFLCGISPIKIQSSWWDFINIVKLK